MNNNKNISKKYDLTSEQKAALNWAGLSDSPDNIRELDRAFHNNNSHRERIIKFLNKNDIKMLDRTIKNSSKDKYYGLNDYKGDLKDYDAIIKFLDNKLDNIIKNIQKQYENQKQKDKTIIKEQPKAQPSPETQTQAKKTEPKTTNVAEELTTQKAQVKSEPIETTIAPKLSNPAKSVKPEKKAPSGYENIAPPPKMPAASKGSTNKYHGQQEQEYKKIKAQPKAQATPEMPTQVGGKVPKETKHHSEQLTTQATPHTSEITKESNKNLAQKILANKRKTILSDQPHSKQEKPKAQVQRSESIVFNELDSIMKELKKETQTANNEIKKEIDHSSLSKKEKEDIKKEVEKQPAIPDIKNKDIKSAQNEVRKTLQAQEKHYQNLNNKIGKKSIKLSNIFNRISNGVKKLFNKLNNALNKILRPNK